MGCRSAGVPTAERLGSGKQVKRPMFSVISRPAARLEVAPPEVMRCLFSRFRVTSGVRHLAAPWRMAGGRMAHAKSAKVANRAGGEREGKTHAETRRRGGFGGGKNSTLKTMKTAPRTWKGGREADVQSERGRPAREAVGKRKTSEKSNVFCNLTPTARLEAAPPEVARWLFRGFGVASGGAASCCAGLGTARPKAAPHLVTCHFSLFTPGGRRRCGRRRCRS